MIMGLNVAVIGKFLTALFARLFGRSRWTIGYLTLQLIGILLLLTTVLITVVYLRRVTDVSFQIQLRDNFYSTEQNNTFDYFFSQPQAGLLLPDPPLVPARVSFRTISPAPLPPRQLTVRYNTQMAFSVSVDSTPRNYQALLPTTKQSRYDGLFISLETEEARAPDDVRSLGLQFNYITVQPLKYHNFLLLYAGVFLVYAGVGGLLITLGSRILLTSATLLILGGLLLTGLSFFFGVGILIILMLLVAVVWLRDSTYTVIESLQKRFLVPLGAALSSPWLCLTILLGLGYICSIGFYAVINHNLFRTSNYDLGLYDQGLWLISRGLYPYSSGSGRHIIGNHAAIILYPLSMLYYLWSDVRLLLVFQVAMTALGVVPIYMIAKAHGHRLLGVLVSLVYLTHPATHNANLVDFHPDTLAATALFFVLWGIDRRRWLIVIVCCLVMLACKDNFALIVACIGGWLLLHRHWHVGGMLGLVGISWFVFTTQMLIPYLTGLEGDENIFLERFSAYGDSFYTIFLTFFTRPDMILQELFQPLNREYLWRLFLPFAFLPLLNPRYLLLAMPSLAMNLLSNFAGQKQLIFHYDALILVFLAVTTLYTLLWLAHNVAYQWLIFGLCAVMLLGGWWYTQSKVYLRVVDIHQQINNKEGQFYPDYVYYRRYILSHVPPHASVSAHNYLQPHLSHRQHAYMFPNPFQRLFFYDPDDFPSVPLDYIIYDTRHPWMHYISSKKMIELIDTLQKHGLYYQEMKVGGVLLLHRTGTSLPTECFGSQWNMPHCHPLVLDK